MAAILVKNLPELTSPSEFLESAVGSRISEVILDGVNRNQAMLWTKLRDDVDVVLKNFDGKVMKGHVLAANLVKNLSAPALPGGEYLEADGKDHFSKELTSILLEAAEDFVVIDQPRRTLTTAKVPVKSVVTVGTNTDEFLKNLVRDTSTMTEGVQRIQTANAEMMTHSTSWRIEVVAADAGTMTENLSKISTIDAETTTEVASETEPALRVREMTAQACFSVDSEENAQSTGIYQALGTTDSETQTDITLCDTPHCKTEHVLNTLRSMIHSVCRPFFPGGFVIFVHRQGKERKVSFNGDAGCTVKEVSSSFKQGELQENSPSMSAVSETLADKTSDKTDSVSKEETEEEQLHVFVDDRLDSWVRPEAQKLLAKCLLSKSNPASGPHATPQPADTTAEINDVPAQSSNSAADVADVPIQPADTKAEKSKKKKKKKGAAAIADDSASSSSATTSPETSGSPNQSARINRGCSRCTKVTPVLSYLEQNYFKRPLTLLEQNIVFNRISVAASHGLWCKKCGAGGHDATEKACEEVLCWQAPGMTPFLLKKCSEFCKEMLKLEKTAGLDFALLEQKMIDLHGPDVFGPDEAFERPKAAKPSSFVPPDVHFLQQYLAAQKYKFVGPRKCK